MGIFAGANLLTIPNGYGSSLGLGLRVRPIKRLALGFDVGYGLLAVSSTIQDRWWAMPSVALVVPLRYVQLDFGAGFGVGTTSGYTSWPAYLAAPFTPIWHFTVPAVRVHAIASFPVSRRVDLFARLDFASLLFTGPKSAYTGLADTTWFALWFGFQYWVR